MYVTMSSKGNVARILSLLAFAAAFSAANAARADLELAFVSDFYDKSGDLVSSDDSYKVAQYVQGLSVNAVLATEVNNRYGTLHEYTDHINDVWSPFKSITHAVPGNHDYMTTGAAGFKGYFNVSTTYSSFTRTVGSTTWKIIGLDYSLEADPYAGFVQRFWLDQQLDGEQCSIVYFHKPRWSSGQHGSNTDMDSFWHLMAQHNVELALSGHDHNFERFWPMDADGNRVDEGVTQVVAGLGGASYYNVGTPIANSIKVIDTDSNPVVQPGVLVIHLYDTGPYYLVMYQSVTGALLDYWWGTCY